jgi:2-amino-4-hydroxy-6-hydroxymethyldihydropteridine diphosphokinase
MSRRAFFSLGSNLGDRAALLELGVRTVASDDPYRISQVYETAPIGGVEQEPFYNLVLELVTEASALELLARCQLAERLAKRVREVHWGPRTLDADVLVVDGETSTDERILLPHPRMFERRFVLEPLSELAPDIATPALRASAGGEVRVLGTLASLL